MGERERERLERKGKKREQTWGGELAQIKCRAAQYVRVLCFFFLVSLLSLPLTLPVYLCRSLSP